MVGVLLCAGSAIFWFSMMRLDMRLNEPGVVVITAALMAVSIWLAFAYILFLLDVDHDRSSANWLRPGLFLYVALSVSRAAFYRPFIRRLLKTVDDER